MRHIPTPCPEPAANQDAPINKDSKSPIPRSLRQHTPAEPIPPCCFYFYPAREIGRSPIQISRCLLHPIEVKVLNKVLILVAFAYILCLRTPSPAFAITSPRLLHLPWDFQLQQWPVTVPTCQLMDPFAMPTDRRKDSRFGTKLGGDEGIVLRACLGRSFGWALSYQRESIWGLV